MIRYKFVVRVWPNLSIPEMETACVVETPVSTFRPTPCYNHYDYTVKNSHFQIRVIYSSLNLARLLRLSHTVLLARSAYVRKGERLALQACV
jgi:hypothetical protein